MHLLNMAGYIMLGFEDSTTVAQNTNAGTGGSGGQVQTYGGISISSSKAKFGTQSLAFDGNNGCGSFNMGSDGKDFTLAMCASRRISPYLAARSFQPFDRPIHAARFFMWHHSIAEV